MLKRSGPDVGHIWLKVLLAVICSIVAGLGLASSSASAADEGEFLSLPVFRISFWLTMYQSAPQSQEPL